MTARPKGPHDPTNGTFDPMRSHPAKGRPFEYDLTLVSANYVRMVSKSVSPCTVEFVPGLAPVGRYIALFFLMSGSLALHTRARTIRAAPGTLIIRDPTEPYMVKATQTTRTFSMLMRHDQFFARTGISPDHANGCVFTPETTLQRMMRSVFMVVGHAIPEIDARDADQIRDGILSFVSLVLREHLRQATHAAPDCRERQRGRAIDLMQKYLSQAGTTMEKIAEDAGISTRYLSDLFHEIGTTPRNYLTDIRLEHASIDLREGALMEQPVASIATANGFSSAAHFSRLFKNRFGVTPLEWRKAAGVPWQTSSPSLLIKPIP